MKLTSCKLCGAQILFVDTVNGKAIPLDAKGERRVVLVTRALGPGEPDHTVAKVEETFTPHQATCRAREKKDASNG